MNLTESQWKTHNAYLSCMAVFGFLGIDLTKWDFNDCRGYHDEGVEHINVSWSNPKVDDVGLMVDFERLGSTWCLEQLDMNLD